MLFALSFITTQDGIGNSKRFLKAGQCLGDFPDFVASKMCYSIQYMCLFSDVSCTYHNNLPQKGRSKLILS